FRLLPRAVDPARPDHRLLLHAADGRAPRPKPPLHRGSLGGCGARSGGAGPGSCRRGHRLMVKKASLRHRLYHGETSYDFMGRKKLWFAISALIIAAGVVSLVTQGLNLGIDFKGGTSWTVKAPHESVSSLRDTVRPLGLGDATIPTQGHGDVRNCATSI